MRTQSVVPLREGCHHLCTEQALALGPRVDYGEVRLLHNRVVDPGPQVLERMPTDGGHRSCCHHLGRQNRCCHRRSYCPSS